MFRQPQATPARYQEMRPSRAPEPPLNPYMRYSRKYWHRVRLENQDRPLWDIAKIIANKWREAPEAEKMEYQQQYEHERLEYEKALKAFMNNPNNQQSAMQKRAMKQTDRSGRRQEPNAGVIIQPVNDEDPFEATPERIAAMRFERNQRLLLELFNGNPMPDARSFIGPQRIEALRKQADNLEAHKKRIADDMAKAEELFNSRKRAIEKASEEFEVALNEACEKRPKVTEEFYNNLVEEQSKKLLEQYEAYKKRQEAIRAQAEAERKETPILYSLTVSPPEPEPTTETPPENMETDEKTEETDPPAPTINGEEETKEAEEPGDEEEEKTEEKQ